MYVMKLRPAGKDSLWGGTRLREQYGKNLDISPIAETWECSTHPDGESLIVNGEYAGKTLADIIKMHPEYLGIKFNGMTELPILVKLIDAKQNLSVQVHPDDVYAAVHEFQRGKTEMWYVLEADAEATLVYGFEHKVNPAMLKRAIAGGTLGKHLHIEKVHKGDVFYMPAGTVHGIGAGVLLAEIQESSNVTNRLYDFDRIDKNGNKRELHFDKAMDVADMRAFDGKVSQSKLVKYMPNAVTEKLCNCRYFDVSKLTVLNSFDPGCRHDSFMILLCINGGGLIKTASGEVMFMKGDCMFVPAGLCGIEIDGRSELLRIVC